MVVLRADVGRGHPRRLPGDLPELHERTARGLDQAVHRCRRPSVHVGTDCGVSPRPEVVRRALEGAARTAAGAASVCVGGREAEEAGDGWDRVNITHQTVYS